MRFDANEPTWKIVPATEKPILGEFRIIRRLVPAPWEPLASMIELWEQVIWDGVEWVKYDPPAQPDPKRNI